MKYEVWCGEVKAYESELEADVRVLVDGVEVFSLSGMPTFDEGPEGFTRELTGGTTSASYVDDKGKGHKVLDKVWTP